jgi:hypothetical protein
MSSPVQIPDEQAKLAEVSTEVSAVVARARAIEVETDAQAQDAAGFLVEIKAAKSRAERARKYLIELPTLQVKRLNAVFKETAGPLDEADRLVRAKLTAFISDQERLRAEEQARLDAQREREEAEARAERERSEREAREAEEAAERLREMADVEQAELERQMEMLDIDALKSLTIGGEEKERVAAKHVIERRLADRIAEKRRLAAEEATQADIAAQSAPALAVAPPAPLASVSIVHEWKATIVDESRLPRWALVPDMKAINTAMREGNHDIPGVKIELRTAVRAHG